MSPHARALLDVLYRNPLTGEPLEGEAWADAIVELLNSRHIRLKGTLSRAVVELTPEGLALCEDET